MVRRVVAIGPIALGVSAALLMAAMQRPEAGAAGPITVVRHYSPADRITGRYQYVPFEVPPGTATLNVAYEYDRAGGENVVDLGLFEPGSLDLGTPAFRGYSGGARSKVTIGSPGATPGYRPGPLPAGRWHLLLGLYKVAPGGVGVTMRIEPIPGPPAPAPPEPIVPRHGGSSERRWYAGALHTHTLHSDGSVAPLEVVRLVRQAGFDFVAITDHNNTTHAWELHSQMRPRDRPLWIVGEEVTTPGGHASVWGLPPGGWVDFRVSPADGRIADLVAAATRQGALFSINHPASDCPGCAWEHDVVDGIVGMEVANSRHPAEQQAALARWDALLRAGRRITGVGASDWHREPAPIDVPHVRVYADRLSTDAILDGIRAGRVIVMREAIDATPEVTVRAGDRVARAGDTLSAPAGTPVRIDIDAPVAASGHAAIVVNGEREAAIALDAQGRGRWDGAVPAPPGVHRYVRVELSAADGAVVALTNPVHLTRP